MSINALSGSGSNVVRNITQAVLKNFDTDQDGQLSANEFAGLLNRIIADPQSATFLGSSVAEPAIGIDSTVARTKVDMSAFGDLGKLNDVNHTSFKYRIGRILQYYPHTPQGLQQALPEIQQLVPGARIVGTKGDKIDFGDYTDPKSGVIGVVDVLRGAGEGGLNWQWEPIAR